MVEHVLRAVEAIPPGRVASYGDIAALMGGTPRQVGAVMRFYGANVAWWRVTDAAGVVPAHLRDEVRAHWAAEGIAWAEGRCGCRIGQYRVDRECWAVAYGAAVVDLPTYRRGRTG